MKYRLTIEYLGTRYSGWQIQKNAKTVQGKIVEALEKAFPGEKFFLNGAGRTDSGVHALGQVADLAINTNLKEEVIKFRINDNLPYDINILDVKRAKDSFSARRDAVSRVYLYQITERRSAFSKDFCWWVKDRLSFEKMESASKLFIGMHDFHSFADNSDETKSSMVLIEEVELKHSGSMLLLRVKGSHFLWKMVRRMTGVLVEVGRGNLKESDIGWFLNKKTNAPARYTAPPSGLFLEKVIYENPVEITPVVPVINIK